MLGGKHFINKKKTSLDTAIETVPQEGMQTLIRYDWPGNVRELENVIERAMILSPGPALALDHSLLGPVQPTAPQDASPRLEDIERAHIERVLASCNGKIKGPNGAAQQLGMKPSTLRYRMTKLGIVRS